MTFFEKSLVNCRLILSAVGITNGKYHANFDLSHNDCNQWNGFHSFNSFREKIKLERDFNFWTCHLSFKSEAIVMPICTFKRALHLDNRIARKNNGKMINEKLKQSLLLSSCKRMINKNLRPQVRSLQGFYSFIVTSLTEVYLQYLVCCNWYFFFRYYRISPLVYALVNYKN